ncbi:thiolase family protein [Geomesophilobacter sediminis]|uniref:Thiolase family protein n=1 Tax=Geomesophilobacter sediminis TaxID=2798584 RepID=A0A8J7J0Q4_9BACT|nr:thiolase family protein [Geomesophilobacter sediminis]MBJ6726212.1 thiolase family protein [Geomesophilobacter sediminis]
MKEVLIIDALRTPIGSLNGVLADQPAHRLAATIIKRLVAEHGLAGDAIDEVIIGQVLSGGCGQAPARQAMREAGLPDAVHAMTINKVCGSGLKAIMLGADSIRLDESSLVLAGGMESMSQAPYIIKKARTGLRMGHGELLDLMIYDGLQDPYTGRHMGMIGDDSARRNGISREEQDEFAGRSYRLAQNAVREGIFAGEIVPVVKQGRKGEERVEQDEEPFKADYTKLAQLRPVFSADGTVTAGNASTINDGAAMALLAGPEAAQRFGLAPKARLVAHATASFHPDHFPEAPVAAIEAVCRRADVPIDRIDLFEINEAFANVPLIAIKKLALPLEKVNVNGGACAIGHPIGASGARLLATLVRELGRRQARYGLATLCIGGGEAVAAIIERI